MGDVRKRLDGIQALRAIAAVLVMMSHSIMIMGVKAGNPALLSAREWSGIGGGGVDIFFVIRGFIMVYIYQQRQLLG